MNPLRGDAAFLAGEQSYRLAFDVNAFCYAESELAPLTADEIVAQFSAGTASLTTMRVLVWAGLQRHHSGTHLAQAGEIMSDAGMPIVRAAITSAFVAAFGEVTEDKDGKNPPKKAVGTGSRSSRAGVKRGSNPRRSGSKLRD